MIRLCNRFVVPRVRIHRVPRGSAGTLVTARLIAQMVLDGAKDFYVRQKAIQIFRLCGVRPKNRFGEVCALFDWVRRNVRYTRDIFRVELLTSGAARVGWLSSQQAARLLAHLPGGKRARPMVAGRCDGGAAHRLGAAGPLETRV